MRPIYISSNAFPVKTIDAILKECATRGIDWLELGSGVAYDHDARKKIIRARKKINILLHNYFPAPAKSFVLNLASPDKIIQKQSRSLVRTALEISHEIEAPVYAVHSGFCYHAEAGLLGKKQTHLKHFSMRLASEIFLEAIQNLAKDARRLGVTLLIENNVLPAFNLVNSKNKSYLVVNIQDSLRTMKQVSNWGVGLLLDTGHLNVSATALRFSRIDYLEALRHYIKAFQVSDNDGTSDEHKPLKRDSWSFKALQTFPEGLPITLEVNNYLPQVIRNREQLINLPSL